MYIVLCLQCMREREKERERERKKERYYLRIISVR